MAERGRAPRETHTVSFKMPAAIYRDYRAAADAHGVDLSSLLNWVIADCHPVFLKHLAQIRLATQEAAGESPRMGGCTEAA